MTVQLLDFEEFIPPFATARGIEILKGVNYASGSAGILNETGEQLVIICGIHGVTMTINLHLIILQRPCSLNYFSF